MPSFAKRSMISRLIRSSNWEIGVRAQYLLILAFLIDKVCKAPPHVPSIAAFKVAPDLPRDKLVQVTLLIGFGKAARRAIVTALNDKQANPSELNRNSRGTIPRLVNCSRQDYSLNGILETIAL